MRHEQSVQVASRMAAIQHQYSQMKGRTQLSLQSLFNFHHFNLTDFCQSFAPHRESKQLTWEAKRFCDRYGIWLPNAHEYISCALYLYPLSPNDRMMGMLNNLAIGYYLNDIMGRDLFKYLSVEKQAEYSVLVDRLVSALPPFNLRSDVKGVEGANLEMLEDIYSHSPKSWFAKFLPVFSKYIEYTHRDNDSAALGHIPSVADYIESRYITSGMGHIVLFIEYSEGDFLDWDLLGDLQLTEVVNSVHRNTALFGALLNDLFSFEKEVIDNNADSNLMMAVALNNTELTLQEVIGYSATVIREILERYLEGIQMIRAAITQLPFAQKNVIENHLAGLDRCVQASWLWQVFTRRYKRQHSIWVETNSD